jgi:hypothetical protein
VCLCGVVSKAQATKSPRTTIHIKQSLFDGNPEDIGSQEWDEIPEGNKAWKQSSIRPTIELPSPRPDYRFSRSS